MNFAEIPRVYLTLKCNYRCGYCPLDVKKSNDISGDEWIKILNEWPGDSVILAGGEPTIHPDFAKIVNGLEKADVRIYSNMSFDSSLFERLEKKCSWYVSYHPGHRDTAAMVATRVAALKGHGHTLINVHANEASGDTVESAKNTFALFNLNLEIEKDLFDSDQWVHHVSIPLVNCTYPRVYIGPDGRRYHCVKLMLESIAGGYDGGVIPDRRFPSIRECALFGSCNPCDVVVHQCEAVQ